MSIAGCPCVALGHGLETDSATAAGPQEGQPAGTSPSVRQQVCGQGRGLAERDAVPAGKNVDIEAEALGGDTALKLQRKEPVVCAHNDPCRHVRPGLERPWVCHRPVRLRGFAPPARFGDEESASHHEPVKCSMSARA